MDRKALNEHRRRLFGTETRTVVYVCECGDSSCLASVMMTSEQVESIRPGLLLADGDGIGVKAGRADSDGAGVTAGAASGFGT